MSPERAAPSPRTEPISPAEAPDLYGTPEAGDTLESELAFLRQGLEATLPLSEAEDAVIGEAEGHFRTEDNDVAQATMEAAFSGEQGSRWTSGLRKYAAAAEGIGSDTELESPDGFGDAIDFLRDHAGEDFSAQLDRVAGESEGSLTRAMALEKACAHLEGVLGRIARGEVAVTPDQQRQIRSARNELFLESLNDRELLQEESVEVKTYPASPVRERQRSATKPKPTVEPPAPETYARYYDRSKQKSRQRTR
jgi:hypothetical protein